jgi:hypothetical protein
MIPIALDALCVDKPLKVVDAMADFSRLPFYDTKAGIDVNAGTAYISEDLVSLPFQDNFTLKPGVHLHWALPNALTRSRDIQSDKDELEFPAVPNHWLVTRVSVSDNNEEVKHWMVESDYLHPVRDGETSGAICYPVRSGSPLSGQKTNVSDPPFRYMGRVLPKKSWDKLDDDYDDLKKRTGYPLTALGYGEPAFSALYPNCHSVFGFWDANPPKPQEQVTYYVTGWYRDPKEDFCNPKLYADIFNNRYKKKEAEQPSWHSFLRKAFSETFGWKVRGEGTDVPERTLYYARLKLNSDSDNLDSSAEPVAVSMGNTATEALSAFLGHTHLEDTAIVEDRLEALHLMGDLDHLRIDIGPKFLEARHARGFQAVPGGNLWRLAAVPHEGPKADVTKTPEQVTLSSDLAHLLNELNIFQQRCDANRFKLESCRERTFSDWYKYMLCAYPPGDQSELYPEIDEVRFFIEKHDLPQIEELETSIIADEEEIAASKAKITETLAEYQLVEADEIADWVQLLEQIRASSLEALVSLNTAFSELPEKLIPEAIGNDIRNKILAELRQLGQNRELDPAVRSEPFSLRYNRLFLENHLPALKHRPDYALKKIAGPRFWQPNDPVILLNGKDVEPTDRHGQDGVLDCDVFHGKNDSLQYQADALRTKINSIYPDTADNTADTPASPAPKGFRNTNGKPWHPFLLDWEVEVQSLAGNTSNLHQLNRAFSKEFITDHFNLPKNSVDLTPRLADISSHSAIYQGRSMLTPQAKPLLLERIADYLEKHLLPEYCKTYKVPTTQHRVKWFKNKENRKQVFDWYRGLSADTRMLMRYFEAKDIADDPVKSKYLEGHRLEVEGWYEKNGYQSIELFIDRVLEIEARIGSGFHALAQALTGFNAALLGHKQTMQLGVADPLAFPDDVPLKGQGLAASDYQAFAKKVKEAVGGFNRVAPQPMVSFNPIRTGKMKISQLRLIDTFGRHLKVAAEMLDDAVVSDTLRSGISNGGESAEIGLPPRLVQPVRLNLRWLSNGHGPGHEEGQQEDIESNAHPATSPICGWLLPNNLDNSLVVYDANGKALGFLDLNGQWRQPPGDAGVPKVALIPNPHLRRVLQWIETTKGKNSHFQDAFLSALDSALENIDPENWSQHEDIALLIGRPLAVVRASVGLQLKGLPAINQDWEAFRKALPYGRQPDIDNDCVQDVQFPVRLGEHRQLNDGLAGFWKENTPEGNLDSEFYSPQSDKEDRSDGEGKRHVIHTYQDAGVEKSLNLLLSLNDKPQVLTMLMDPRGKLHASCGIVPTKQIAIPPDQFAAALQAIEITFLTAPILSSSNPLIEQEGDEDSPSTCPPIDLPLPHEPGYVWRWGERDGAHWKETTQLGRVKPEAELAGSTNLRDGWLVLGKQRS